MVGSRVVLLHGWSAAAEKFRSLEQALAKRGWSTLVLELPGFSSTPAPPRAWGVGDYADWVLKKAEAKFGKKKIFVFGHSFGGRIAIKLGSTKPDKLSGIILCSAAGLSRSNSIKRAVFFLLAKIGKILLLVPPLARVWRRLLYKLAREHDYERTEGIMREVFKKVVAEDIRPLLPQIRPPTLILWGDKDKMTPLGDAYLAKEKIKNSRLKIFENQGHKLPYESPAAVAEEITKWSQTLP